MPKIGLDQIIVSENVRKDYRDIEELADSIRKRGQLEPVIVKKAKAEGGEARYELVAGFRRHRAIKLLEKDGYTQIEAVVVTGDRLTIQLIENLQRSDLSAREREEGIALMVQGGLSQKEVAAELSKKPDYISRHIKAFEIRQIAEAANIDTSDLETFTLTEIATVKKEDIPMILGYVKNGGGTKEAARKIMAAYRGNKAPESVEVKPEPPAPEPAPVQNETRADVSMEPPPPVTEGGADIDPLAGVKPDAAAPEAFSKFMEGNFRSEKNPPRHREPISRESTNPDHRLIDLQNVFDKIYGYLERLEKKIETVGPESEEGIIAQYKLDAAYDIVAELHQVESE